MPRGTRVSKERKRVAVARQLVAGANPPAIAREVGCSPQHVQALAREPETQALIRDIMAPHRKRLAKMATRAINAVDKALIAQKTDRMDHAARMRAVRRYGDLLELADGGKRHDPAGESGGQFTLVQIMQLLQLTEVHDESKPA